MCVSIDKCNDIWVKQATSLTNTNVQELLEVDEEEEEEVCSHSTYYNYNSESTGLAHPTASFSEGEIHRTLLERANELRRDYHSRLGGNGSNANGIRGNISKGVDEKRSLITNKPIGGEGTNVEKSDLKNFNKFLNSLT